MEKRIFEGSVTKFNGMDGKLTKINDDLSEMKDQPCIELIEIIKRPWEF